MSGNDNPRFHCVRRNRWIPVPVPKPPGQRRHCLHDDLASGHFPLLTIEAGTQGTWCGADFLYNLYNGCRMMQPSHSKVLHPTPDIGHNPDCVARVLTHPGGTRWCKDGAKSHKNWDGDVIHQRLWLHPPAIVGELKRQIKSSYCGYHKAKPIFLAIKIPHRQDITVKITNNYFCHHRLLKK